MLTPHARAMFRYFIDSLRKHSHTALPLVGLLLSLSSLNAVQAEIKLVPVGAELQTWIDLANPGDELVLQPGAVYVGPIRLRVKSGSAYITIRTSAIADLPDGVRVTPAQAALMPKIVSQGAGESALQTDVGAHHYKIIGIEFKQANGSAVVFDLIRLGDTGINQNTLGQVPHHITIDRCYIHGLPGSPLKRGIALNSADTSILNSYISDFKVKGQDAQAICGWNGPGPFQITNNYLEGAGENVLFGGADPSIPNLVPSNITVTRNHFAKPLSWRGSPHEWTIKNLFELKNAQDVTINGNLFEYSWDAAQDGYAILFTTRNEENTAPWSIVQRVQFTNNVVRHAAAGFQISSGGPNAEHPTTLRTNHITIRNNLFYDISDARWGARGIFMVITGQNDYLTVDHNTVDETVSVTEADGVPSSQHFVFTNNIVQHGLYGVHGAGRQEGTDTLNTFFPGADFRRNVIIGANSSLYPSNNFFPSSINDVGFYNPSAGDYRLAARLPNGNPNPYKNAGTDGKDIGYAHPLEDARTFVRQHYLDFLRREPDAPGWDYWTNNITKCYDPAQRPAGQTEAQCIDKQRETTSGAFFLSPEFQYTGYYVYRIYKGSLGRLPNKVTEFDPDQAYVANGIIVNNQLSGTQINANKQSFAAQFVTRPAFTSMYGSLTNAQYVQKLSETTGIPLTQAERDTLVNGLNSGAETRATVLFKVVDGINVISEGNQQFTTRYGQEFYKKEFNAAFVFMQYVGYLRRDPDKAGYDHWLGKLNFYGNYIDAEMVRSFIISPEYLSRFGAPDIGYVGKQPVAVLEQSSAETFREERLAWTNAVGLTVSGSSLISTGSGWGTSGAVSTQAIVAGDGYAEFTATETSTYKMFGLSRGDTDQMYTDIDFAIYLGYGSLYVYEAGVYRGGIGTYTANDRLRVAVEGGQVKYMLNGTTLYTSSVAPLYPLLVDTSLYSYGATISDARLVGTLDHGTAAGSVPFYSGFESGQQQPDWYNSADYITGVTGYCCGLTYTESSPRQEAARLGTTSLMYSGYDTSAGGPSYSYNKVFDVNIPVTANTELTYWIYPQAVGGNNSAYVSIDLFCTDGSSLRDSGAVDQWGVRVHPAYQGAGGRLVLNQWNLVRSRFGAQLAGKTIYRIYIAYDQPQNTGPYRGYVDDISIVDRIP